MATLLPDVKQSYTTATGAPLVGGRLYTYDAGTSTPRPTYSDAAGLVPNTNPVILDARGEAVIFWAGAYKVVLRDAADVIVIPAVDNIVSGEVLDTAMRADLANSASAAKGAALVALTPGVAYPAGSVGAAVGLGANGAMAQKRFEATNTDDTDTPDASFRVNRTLSNATVASGHGFRDQTVFSRGVGSSYAAFDSHISVAGADTHDHAAGFQARNIMAGSASVLHWYNFVSSPVFNSGTVTNNYGLYAFNPTGTGTVANNYGFFIPQQTKGTVLNYSGYISQQGAPFFCGSPLHVNNLLRVGTAQYIVGGVTTTGYPYAGYNYEPTTGNYQAADIAITTSFDTNGFRVLTAAAGTAGAPCTLVERLRVDLSGNSYGQAGAAAMTNGFQYMPSGAGLPGAPAALPAGRVPFYFDTSTGKIGVYSGGAWKWTAALV